MSLTELLPNLKELNRADKLRAMQFLLAEITKEEAVLLLPDGEYPVWSPYDADEAGQTLLAALEAEETHA
jgi:hypothetical protein